jgi:hypothetical protein
LDRNRARQCSVAGNLPTPGRHETLLCWSAWTWINDRYGSHRPLDGPFRSPGKRAALAASHYRLRVCSLCGYLAATARARLSCCFRGRSPTVIGLPQPTYLYVKDPVSTRSVGRAWDGHGAIARYQLRGSSAVGRSGKYRPRSNRRTRFHWSYSTATIARWRSQLGVRVGKSHAAH